MKTGGLLEKVSKNDESGICRSCHNLIQISKNAFGCVVHDKLIIPDYPPYHGNMRCNDWGKTGA